MSFPVNSLIAALFFPRLHIANGAALANEFIRRTGSELDHEPIVLPIGQPTPPEAPRIILRSRDRSYRLEFALTRVNFVYNHVGGPTSTLSTLFPRYRETLYHVIEGLYEQFVQRPQRMGFVGRLLKPTPIEGGAFLRAALLRRDLFEGSLESRLDFLRRIELEGMPCNFWVRFRSVQRKNLDGDSEPANVVVFEADVNTLVENQRAHESHEAVAFFLEACEAVRREADRLLDFEAEGDDEEY